MTTDFVRNLRPPNATREQEREMRVAVMRGFLVDCDGRPTPEMLADMLDAFEAEIELGLAQQRRCTCPVGFGQVADPDCPRHQGAKHTITGPPHIVS